MRMELSGPELEGNVSYRGGSFPRLLRLGAILKDSRYRVVISFLDSQINRRAPAQKELETKQVG